MARTSESLATRYPGHALVTGASSGIGAAFARQLAAAGLPLVLTARHAEPLQRLADTLSTSHGIEVVIITCDLSAIDGDAVLVTQIEERGIDIGLLVNNAGFGTDGRAFLDTSRERMLAMIDLHCRATLGLTHRLLPGMQSRGRGGILFTSSIAAYQPTPGFAAYGASKAFELSLAEALWAEHEHTGIDVLAVSPGVTDTNFFRASGRDGGGEPPMSPDHVAAIALQALGRRCSVVPGWKNRLKASAYRLLPRATLARLAARVARSHARGSQQ